MLAPSLLAELRQKLLVAHGDHPEIELAGGTRKAFCFRGESARSDAEDRAENINGVVIFGPKEITPGTYCFVL